MDRVNHPLWETHEWEVATDEQIIAALFNAPEFPDPRDMGWLRCNKPSVIRQYQSLFYGGSTPSYAANPNKDI